MERETCTRRRPFNEKMSRFFLSFAFLSKALLNLWLRGRAQEWPLAIVLLYISVDSFGRKARESGDRRSREQRDRAPTFGSDCARDCGFHGQRKLRNTASLGQ